MVKEVSSAMMADGSSQLQRALPDEHKAACSGILDYLAKDPQKFQFFEKPAINGLGEEEAIEYRNLISEPRDLTMIREKLADGQYSTIKEFRDDVELCFDNCKNFCRNRYHEVYVLAGNFTRNFRGQMDRIQKQLGIDEYGNPLVTPEVQVMTRAPRGSALLANNAITKLSNEASMTEQQYHRARNGSARQQQSSTGSKKSSPDEPQLIPLHGYEIHCERIHREVSNMNELAKLLWEPVSTEDFPDYTARIPHPIAFNDIKQRLSEVGNRKDDEHTSLECAPYQHLGEFAQDMRRIVGNCIRYNCTVDSAPIRRDAAKLFLKFEKLWEELLAMLPSTHQAAADRLRQPIAPIDTEFKGCLDALEASMKARSVFHTPELPLNAAVSFIDPVNLTLEASVLKQYLKMVKQPMSLGEIISKLCEGEYPTVSDFKSDVHLVVTNCQTYWSKYDSGQPYITDAKAIETAFLKALPGGGSSSVAATGGSSTQKKPTGKKVSSVADAAGVEVMQAEMPTIAHFRVAHPMPKQADTEILPATLKRAAKFTNDAIRLALDESKKHFLVLDDGTRVFSSGPFIYAVDPTKFPDYQMIITNPMYIQRMEKNLVSGRYENLDTAAADMELIRRNAHKYNTGDENVLIRRMADGIAATFRHVLRDCLRELRDSEDVKLFSVISGDSRTGSLAYGGGDTAFIQGLISGEDDPDVIAYLETLLSDSIGGGPKQPAKPAVTTAVTTVKKSSGMSQSRQKSEAIANAPKAAPKPIPKVQYRDDEENESGVEEAMSDEFQGEDDSEEDFDDEFDGDDDDVAPRRKSQSGRMRSGTSGGKSKLGGHQSKRIAIAESSTKAKGAKKKKARYDDSEDDDGSEDFGVDSMDEDDGGYGRKKSQRSRTASAASSAAFVPSVPAPSVRKATAAVRGADGAHTVEGPLDGEGKPSHQPIDVKADKKKKGTTKSPSKKKAVYRDDDDDMDDEMSVGDDSEEEYRAEEDDDEEEYNYEPDSDAENLGNDFDYDDDAEADIISKRRETRRSRASRQGGDAGYAGALEEERVRLMIDQDIFEEDFDDPEQARKFLKSRKHRAGSGQRKRDRQFIDDSGRHKKQRNSSGKAAGGKRSKRRRYDDSDELPSDEDEFSLSEEESEMEAEAEVMAAIGDDDDEAYNGDEGIGGEYYDYTATGELEDALADGEGEDAVMVAEWALACEAVLQNLDKHPYIELKSNSVVGNFHVPVIVAYPELKEKYLKVISEPMDLTTLRNRLYAFEIRDSEEFYRLVTTIFQNGITFSEPDPTEEQAGVDEDSLLVANMTKWRREKFRFLLQYCRWLSLETLQIAESVEEETKCIEDAEREDQAKETARVTAELTAMSAEDKEEHKAVIEECLPQLQVQSTRTSTVSAVELSEADVEGSAPGSTPQELAVEALDVEAPTITQRPLRFARLAERNKERTARETMLAAMLIDRASGLGDCDRLWKEAKRTKNKSEQRHMDIFLLPLDETQLAELDDYYVHVRKPMDFSTIKYRLDGTLPHIALPAATGGAIRSKALQAKIQQHSRYKTYGEFFSDLKLVFDNAIRYNSQHKADNEVSAQVHTAALTFRKRLEEAIASFTLRVIDKLERIRLKREEDAEREASRWKYLEKVEQSVAEFEAKEKEKLMKEDEFFAADLDASRRREQTSAQLQAEREERQQKVAAMLATASNSAMTALADEWTEMAIAADNQGHVEEVVNAHMQAEAVRQAEEKRLQKLAEAARLPSKFARTLEAKILLREAAWRRWEPLAIKRVKPLHHVHSTVLDSSDSDVSDENNDDPRQELESPADIAKHSVSMLETQHLVPTTVTADGDININESANLLNLELHLSWLPYSRNRSRSRAFANSKTFGAASRLRRPPSSVFMLDSDDE